MSNIGLLLSTTEQDDHQTTSVRSPSEAYALFAESADSSTSDVPYFPFEPLAGEYHTKMQEASNFFDSQHQFMSFNHPHLPELNGEHQQLQFPTPAPTRGSSPQSHYKPSVYQIQSLVHPDDSFYHPMSNSVYNINEIAEEEYQENNFIPTFNVQVKPKRKYLRKHVAGSMNSIDGSNPDETERKRRSQVKVACIHCKKACKKCDDIRPCTRCVRIGFGNNCLDAPRKERKKGFKRGPYNKGRRDSMESVGEDWSPVDSGNDTVRSYEPTKFAEQPMDKLRVEQQMIIAPETAGANGFGTEQILFAPQIHHGDEKHSHQHSHQHEDHFYPTFPLHQFGESNTPSAHEHFEQQHYSEYDSGYFFPGASSMEQLSQDRANEQENTAENSFISHISLFPDQLL